MFNKFKLNSLLTVFIILTIIFTPLYSVYADATYEWAKEIVGSSSVEGKSVTTDTSGNVYTIGQFSGTADFNPGAGTANLTSAGSSDIFISKLDSNGDYVWAKRIGGTSNDTATSVMLDSSGNIYISGTFNDVADLDPGEGVVEFTTRVDDGEGGYFSGYSAFITKLDSSGNYVWAKNFMTFNASSSSIYNYGITVDSSGNVYTIGNFNGGIDFDPGVGTANLISAGSSDIFISKLDSNGDYIWAKRIGGVGVDNASSVTLDVSGDIYLAGYFINTVDFDPGVGVVNLTSTTSLSPGDEVSFFTLKLDSSGNYVWVRSVTKLNESSALSHASGIAIDSSNNVYTIGNFSGTLDFDPGEGISELTTGDLSFFMLKLDSSGNYVWSKSLPVNSNYVSASSIYTDSFSSLYITGYFYGTADFDPNAGTSNLVSIGSNDIFIAKYDSGGDLVWAEGAGGTIEDSGNSVYVDSDDNVYATGFFQNSTTFDLGGDDIVLAGSANYNSFITKLSQSTTPTLTTSPATSTERSTTTLNGSVTSTGGVNPTIRGFNYGLTTSYGTNTTENGSFSTGTYTSNLTELECNTTYHYRAYATNSVGTSYGSDLTFTTASCPSTSGSYARSSPYFTTTIPTVVTPPTPTVEQPLVPSINIPYTRTLKLTIPRMIGDDIKTLQEFLNSKGYTIPTTSYQKILNLPSSDGVYGPLTRQAVIQFQTANNLVPDGAVGPKTREKVKELMK